jgi:four helix bundle protein
VGAREAGSPVQCCEGFVRYGHPEFLHFLEIARASLAETQNHLLDAGSSDMSATPRSSIAGGCRLVEAPLSPL